MDQQKSTEQANLFDCFQFLNPMREKNRRKSKSKSQKSTEPESTGIDWMEVSSTVRTEKAEIEYVNEAESSWAEFWVEDNAEIYDDLEVVYSDIKIESLRRKPNLKRKISPVIENMTMKLIDDIFEDLMESAFQEKTKRSKKPRSKALRKKKFILSGLRIDHFPTKGKPRE